MKHLYSKKFFENKNIEKMSFAATVERTKFCLEKMFTGRRRKIKYSVLSQNDEGYNESHSNFSIFKGLALAMASGIFFSSAAVLVKEMKNIATEQLVLYRFIGMLVFSAPETIKVGGSLLGPKKYRWLLILRGVFGATNVSLAFFAFRYLPLGDASVIIFSVPVFVTIAARIFLKEKCGFFQSITLFITIIGIVITTKLPLQFNGENMYSKHEAIGFSCAIASLLFNTARYIVMRKVKSVHHSIVVFTSAWVSVIEIAIFIAVVGHFQWQLCGIEKLYAILLGVVSYLGQTLLTMAIQCEQAGPVSTIRAASDIILGFLWQIFLFHDMPDMFSLSGAFLVLISVVFVGLQKWVSTLSRESLYFNYLKWMQA